MPQPRHLMLWLAAVAGLRADVRLPAIFSDHMVVQSALPAGPDAASRHPTVAIWGWADPGEPIKISLAGKPGSAAATAVAGPDGRWRADLGAPQPGGPYVLTVQGAHNTVAISDVLAGEVWLCSGQSNMEMQVRGLHGEVVDADREIASAHYPEIRMYVFRTVYDIYQLPVPPAEPMTDRPGDWIVCSSATVAKFTAMGYFFGRELDRRLHVPIGLVHSSVGGTPIEAWISSKANAEVPAFQPLLADWARRLDHYDPAAAQEKSLAARAAWQKQRAAAAQAGGPASRAPAPFKNAAVSTPGALFNGMIAPLIPYTIRGMIWYQGERNSAGPFTGLYGLQLRTLIADWRARWHDEFYFGFVQMPSFQKVQRLPSEPNGWGVSVREGELKTLDLPKVGMAVTIDFGGPDPAQGHPKNKQDFAHRLALWARHDVYGEDLPEWSGPIYAGVERRGQELVIRFTHAGGLKAKAGELTGFGIAGADRKFVWARGKIEGDTVVVSAPAVPDPVAVRYAWAGTPKISLCNAAGLPASPFRTDNWK